MKIWENIKDSRKMESMIPILSSSVSMTHNFHITDIVEGVRRCSRTPDVGASSGSQGVSGSGNGSGTAQNASTSTSSKGILRPLIDKDSADEEIINMMTRCWSEDPLDRPDFSALKVAIRKLNK